MSDPRVRHLQCSNSKILWFHGAETSSGQEQQTNHRISQKSPPSYRETRSLTRNNEYVDANREYIPCDETHLKLCKNLHELRIIKLSALNKFRHKARPSKARSA